jgi:hypothetical protein
MSLENTPNYNSLRVRRACYRCTTEPIDNHAAWRDYISLNQGLLSCKKTAWQRLELETN